MNRCGDILTYILTTIKRGPFNKEMGVYEWATFSLWDYTYFIDGMNSKTYKILPDGTTQELKYTCAGDKKYHMIMSLCTMQLKVHRVLAAALKENGDNILEGYEVNHMIIRTRCCDVETRYVLNEAEFLELVTPALNNKHKKFIYDNDLFGLPVSAYDIDFFEAYFKENNILKHQRRDVVYDAYIQRANGNILYMKLHNLLLKYRTFDFKYI